MKNSLKIFAIAALAMFIITLPDVFSQTEVNSYGPVPVGDGYGHKSNQNYTDGPLAGLNVYSWEGVNQDFAYFDATLPGTVIPIVSYPSTNFLNAVEMVAGDNTKLYAVDHAGTVLLVDLNTATVQTLGVIAVSGEVIGIALEYSSGTYYICTSADNLYTVDFNTLTTQYIGNFGTNSYFMIGITFDDQGNLWGYDLALDVFFSINKLNGLATAIGPIGFDANYGQGLGWDPDLKKVVMCAFNNSTFHAEYRWVNTATGATTFLGFIGDPAVQMQQFTSCAIPRYDPNVIPISNWALFIGIGLILAFAMIRFRKLS
ncbi:MAG: hypothetical protein R6W71_02760 [Bacteroidales bacterium]|jgi:hypothetical protein